MKNLKRGFTLVELLVVVAIIGILAVIVTPKLREYLAKAKDSQSISLLGAVRGVTNAILIDKTVFGTGVPATIDLGEILDGLDATTGELLQGTGLIVIGGSRPGPSQAIAYGGNVGFSSTKAQDGTTPTLLSNTSTSNLAVTNGELSIYLAREGGIEIGSQDSNRYIYSTTGQMWSDY